MTTTFRGDLKAAAAVMLLLIPQYACKSDIAGSSSNSGKTAQTNDPSPLPKDDTPPNPSKDEQPEKEKPQASVTLQAAPVTTAVNSSPITFVIEGDGLSVAKSDLIIFAQGSGTLTFRSLPSGGLAIDVTLADAVSTQVIQLKVLPGAIKNKAGSLNSEALLLPVVNFDRRALIPSFAWVPENEVRGPAAKLIVTFDRAITSLEDRLSLSGILEADVTAFQSIDGTKAEVTVSVPTSGILIANLSQGFAADAHGNKSPAASSGQLTFQNFFTSLASGLRHSCGLTFDRSVYCWGDDTYGQLGDGTTINTTMLPVKADFSMLASGEKIAQVAVGGYFSCAVSTAGRLYCWGRDERETVIDGLSLTVAHTPVAANLDFLENDEQVRTVSLGHVHGCLISTKGRTFCWGRGGFGVLGNASTVDTPAAIPTLVVTTNFAASEEFSQIESGYQHSCGVTNQQRVLCWGANGYGQLGAGAGANSGTPLVVLTDNLESGEHITHVSVNSYNSCGLTNLKNVYCWGRDSDGMLGNPAIVGNQDRPVKTDLSPLNTNDEPTGLVVSWNMVSLLTKDGHLYTWGDDAEGNLGNGAAITADQTLPTPLDLTALPTGTRFGALGRNQTSQTCALTATHYAACWGRNDLGQVGIGTTGSVHAPVLLDDDIIQ